jgi:hypothetical protein
MAKSILKGPSSVTKFTEELLKGKDRTENVLLEMLESIKDSIPRKEPSVVPMVNGVPVTLEDYRKALLERYNKGAKFYSELSLKLAKKEDKFKVPWGDVTGLHTDLAGGIAGSDVEEGAGLFNRLLKEKTAKGIFEHYDSSLSDSTLSSPQERLEYFKKYTSLKLAEMGVSSSRTKVKLLVNRGEEVKLLLVGYVKAPFNPNRINDISNDPSEFLWDPEVSIYYEPGRALIAPLDIEHFKALATESAEALLSFFSKVRTNIEENKDVIVSSYPTGTYDKAIVFINKTISDTEKEIDELYKIDNIFVDPTLPQNLLTTEVATDLLSQLEKGPDGTYGFYMIAETSPNSGKVHLLPITVALPDGFASGGSFGNRFWGQRSGVVLNRIIRKFVPLLAESIASNSFITTNILKSLQTIFSFDPKLSDKFKQALKRGFAAKKTNKLFIPVLKGKKFKLKITSAPKVPNPKKQKKSGIQPGFEPKTQNIVPILNAEIKRYVLEQMSYPSLVNRSGRFASSVRVLSAQENAAVQYTYQKSPYQVFSQTRGKPAWNDREERDPAQIIDKAIKKIGMDKFGKVFRTEER